MKTTRNYVLSFSLAVSSFSAHAINNAPADVDTITLRTSCTENSGATVISNCFTSMAAVDTWLRTVRLAGPTRPTLVNIGPGSFAGWMCTSSNVTLKGSGRDRSVLTSTATAAIDVNAGCTNLNVQDLTIDGSVTTNPSWPTVWGVVVFNVTAVTQWTNVEIKSTAYGWIESGVCANHSGRHTFFGSRILSTGNAVAGTSRAYTAFCAQSWFFGSEIVAEVNNNETNAFALEARNAEVHLYGSNARLILASNTTASTFTPSVGGHYLVAALQGSEIHIHGTGLDLSHAGTGTADMLYADSSSHIHANESGFNPHVSGTDKAKRLNGTGSISSPYTWKQSTVPPLSTVTNGVFVSKLISSSGADSYIETDCPASGNCSVGGTFPHEMIYRAECTLTGANQGPWFDMTTKACRQ